MPYTLLSAIGTAADVARELSEALQRTRSWERFVEVRMAAGPTVRISRVDAEADSYEDAVTWGESQSATSQVFGQGPALIAADLPAQALYDVRRSGHVAN